MTHLVKFDLSEFDCKQRMVNRIKARALNSQWVRLGEYLNDPRDAITQELYIKWSSLAIENENKNLRSGEFLINEPKKGSRTYVVHANCEKKQMRTTNGTNFNESMGSGNSSSVVDTDWQYVSSSSIFEAFFIALCDRGGVYNNGIW